MAIKTVRLQKPTYDRLNKRRLRRSSEDTQLFTFDQIIQELLDEINEEK